jgi:hypothetical protein
MRRGIRNLSALLWFLPLVLLTSACQDRGPLGNLPRDDAGPAVARQRQQIRRPEVGSNLLPLILSIPDSPRA